MNDHASTTWKLALTLVAATVGLSGCAGSEPIAAPPAVVESPSPTPTRESERVVTTVVLTPRALELRTADGELVDSFDFFVAEDSTRAIPALTALFGEDPEEEFQPAETHFPDNNRYSWDGFVFNDRDHKGGSSFPEYSDAFVVVDATEVNGISVQTASGSSVGSQVSTIAGAEETIEGDADKDLPSFWTLDRLDVTDDLSFDMGAPAYISVAAESDSATDEITLFRVPAANFGA